MSDTGRERLPSLTKRKKTSKATFQAEADQQSGSDETRALVVHVEHKGRALADTTDRLPESRLAEAIGLTQAIGLKVEHSLIVPLSAPRPATLIGTGKVAEIGKLAEDMETGLVIVNAQLSPIQQRNLEKAWGAKVLDRTGLILEIFGERASTKEGTLQVELAHLQYQKSRLVRSWTHLERQRGGFGFLGGPGESQMEADRRLIQERIAKIERQLGRRGEDPFSPSQGQGTRALSDCRSGRLHKRRKIHAFQQAHLRQCAGQGPVVRHAGSRPCAPFPCRTDARSSFRIQSDLSRTLPTTLIAAFRATLEEVLEADIILHVRDMNHHRERCSGQGRACKCSTIWVLVRASATT